ncbi:MAG: phosphotransferase [Geminicoccaceae bacterium]
MSERNFGEAETDAERAVEAAIARVPAWREQGASYALMTGGISNSNWRITLAGDERHQDPGCRDRDVRRPWRPTRRPGWRTPRGSAPRWSISMPKPPRVAELLEGYRACTNADFAGRGQVQLAASADCYRQFHAGEGLGLTKTIFDMIDEHIAQVAGLGGSLPEDWPWLSRLYGNARSAFLASGLDLVPCFNDPMPGNFLVKQDAPMKLVDYEFASMNERSYELGVWLGEMFFTEDTAARLLEAYAGELRPELVARVAVMRALADVKWATWAMVQEQISALDFDYHKYGTWKYLRARSIMHDFRWEAWLRAL